MSVIISKRSFQENAYTEEAEDTEETEEAKQPLKTSKIIKILLMELMAGFIISLVTLGLFPGLVAQVRNGFRYILQLGLLNLGEYILNLSRSNSKNETWADKYFVSVITFLLFNISDYVGRLMTNFVTLWESLNTNTLAQVQAVLLTI